MHYPMSALAHALITIPHIAATEDDAVRVGETDGQTARTYSECWNRPASPFTLALHHPDDFALSCALASHTDEWPAHIDIHTALRAYRDEHGTWCVECGNSVVTGLDGHVQCTADHCPNYNEPNVPEWCKRRTA